MVPIAAVSVGPSIWAALALAVALLATGAVALLRRRGGGADAGMAMGAASEAGNAASDPTATAVESAGPTDAAADVSDEDRIEDLLRDHGGRMRQSTIVEATGWSKSKTSMTISGMVDDDRVSKLRVGRENLISLPGHEPDAVRSPHEE